jgi:sulfur relay (sulfurtransferase) DsrF/TusC family protein
MAVASIGSTAAFASIKQAQPPQLEDDLQRLMDKGAKVYVTTDDVAERGLERTGLIPGLEPISRSRIAKLCADYDQIWHW